LHNIEAITTVAVAVTTEIHSSPVGTGKEIRCTDYKQKRRWDCQNTTICHNRNFKTFPCYTFIFPGLL